MSITPHAVITENNEINYEIPINAESTKSVLLYRSAPWRQNFVKIKKKNKKMVLKQSDRNACSVSGNKADEIRVNFFQRCKAKKLFVFYNLEAV